jgi:hypothetical protein
MTNVATHGNADEGPSPSYLASRSGRPTPAPVGPDGLAHEAGSEGRPQPCAIGGATARGQRFATVLMIDRRTSRATRATPVR